MVEAAGTSLNSARMCWFTNAARRSIKYISELVLSYQPITILAMG